MPFRTNAICNLIGLLLISTAAASAQDSGAKPLSCDANCARNNADKASQICAPRIEAQAPTDFQWVQRPYGGIFQKAEPAGATLVRYTGDYIRFLSPQKDWVRITYECFFDSVSQSVQTVRVRLGRIDAPAAAQQGAPSARPTPEGERSQTAANGPPQSDPGHAPPPKPRPRVGEPSEIEILQVNPSSRPAGH